MSVRVLVLYDDTGHLIGPLAEAVEMGTRAAQQVEVERAVVGSAKSDYLLAADAIILGCPNWSGITGKLKNWLDEQGDLWEEGKLAGKIGAAFTTSWSRSAGVEFTLLSLIHWMLAAGMIIVGLPWSDRLRTSGSYYGPYAAGEVTRDDLEQARALGERVARVALQLKGLKAV